MIIYCVTEAKLKTTEETYKIRTTLDNLKNLQTMSAVSVGCIAVGCVLVLLCVGSGMFMIELPWTGVIGFTLFFGVAGLILILVGALYQVNYDYNNPKVFDRIRDDLMMAIMFSKIQIPHDEFLVLVLETGRFCKDLDVKNFNTLAMFLSQITVTNETPQWLRFLKHLVIRVVDKISISNISMHILEANDQKPFTTNDTTTVASSDPKPIVNTLPL